MIDISASIAENLVGQQALPWTRLVHGPYSSGALWPVITSNLSWNTSDHNALFEWDSKNRPQECATKPLGSQHELCMIYYVAYYSKQWEKWAKLFGSSNTMGVYPLPAHSTGFFGHSGGWFLGAAHSNCMLESSNTKRYLLLVLSLSPFWRVTRN